MTQKDKILYACMMTVALTATCIFGYLWFLEGGVADNFSGNYDFVDVLIFILVSYVIWHPIFMKMVTYTISSHIEQTPEESPMPEPGMKVAFVTTFVPASESIDLLHCTLPAMVKAHYRHDTWLLDEGNDPEVRELCKKYGVNHFSRHGIEIYNQLDGKYAQKTKGGNHNSWYDKFGDYYEFVAQIDTDFIPRNDFLTKTLGYFKDPTIAFVGTPQIYGNIDDSVIAHGAAQQTYSFYGPLLRGMSGQRASMLIGANHVIRVKALQGVSHYTAHITEDLLTGMKLHANGWKSIYYPYPLAIGEGPTSWKSYFSQQKRWAYGCMDILFSHSYKLFSKMTFRQAIYYFCIQQHYFSGLVMVLGIVSLCLYFYGGIVSVDLPMFEFLGSYIILILLFTCIDFWLQRFNSRPKMEKGVMFYGMYIGVAAWPIYFQAFIALFNRKKLRYKVTPKGKKIKTRDMALTLFAPHFILGGIALSGAVSSIFTGRNSGLMIFWSILTGIGLLIVPVLPHIMRVGKRLFNRNAYLTSTVARTRSRSRPTL
jgi:cellulose synthase/poly-beta-1,6-N-acetylglucosamine synthase-like glycosyltransferase